MTEPDDATTGDPAQRRRRRRPRLLVILIGAVAAVVILVVGGTAFYINVVEGDAPKEFSLNDTSGDEEKITSTDSLSGTWTVASGSEAGYRVKEVLFGQSTTAAGRTSQVSGSVTIAGTVATAADFTVQMASVASDQTRRDNQFRTRIMDVDTYPTATFKLSEPISIGSVPTDSKTVRSVNAKGDLTLRGKTSRVTMTLQSQWDGEKIHLVGQLPIVFADYDIPNPSLPGISTEDHGIMEVSLVLSRSTATSSPTTATSPTTTTATATATATATP